MNINYAKKINVIVSLLVLISPVFFLTVKHWTNLVLLILFASCFYIWFKNKVEFYLTFLSSRLLQIIGAMLVAPLLSILISQTVRQDFYFPNWDNPSRFVLCIPILLLVANGWLRPSTNKSICGTWLTLILPVTLIWTLFFRINWPTRWGPDLTTYFVDPLTFGSYTLLFSLLTLLGLSECWAKLSIAIRLLCFIAILSGFFLSIQSGSRTGWFNFPVFIVIWAHCVLRPKIGGKGVALVLAILMILIIGMLLGNTYLVKKFTFIWTEISDYKVNEINADTSVAMRLSFYRMGVNFFSERPFSGWGDLGWLTQINRMDFLQYASEFTRESQKHGFHNEIITSAVRSGIWGLVASVSLFVVGFVRAIQGMMRKSTGDHRLVSLTLLVFICHLFIAGLTTEITNLVFLSSFIGLTLAVLLGEQIYLESIELTNEKI